MKRLLTVVAAGILGLAGCKGLDSPKPDGQFGVKGAATGQFQTPNAAGNATIQTTNAYRPGAGTAGVQQAGVMQPGAGGAVVSAGGQAAMTACPNGVCPNGTCPAGACAAGTCPTGACMSGQIQTGQVQVGGAVQMEPMAPVRPGQ